MALSPEQVHDLAVKHRINLSRYSTTVVRKVVALLNRTEQSLVERLARTGNETIAGQRLEMLLNDLRQIQSQGWKLIDARINADVADLAPAERDFAASLVEAKPTGITAGIFSPLPSEVQLIAAVNARPFQGRFLKDWLAGMEEGAAAKVRDAVRQGFVEGRTTSDIIKSIRGTKAAGYADGLMESTRRGTEAMVRTALTHTSNVAAQASYAALDVKFLIWTSTLDARTTLICISRSEDVFPIDSGPRPPAHINCRSIMRPKVDNIPGVKPFEAPTYSQWLKGQPASVQDDVLGPTRGKLFRNGGLQVDRFVDNKGKTLTLQELRARDASSFAAAGL